MKAKSIYVISINRLSFEFLEVRCCSDTCFSYKTITNGKESTVKVDSRFLKAKEIGFEIFSIVDMQNDNSRLNLASCDKRYKDLNVIIPKHDYHFFDDKDEHSIRKFMDHMYGYDEDNLIYKSNIPNEGNMQVH